MTHSEARQFIREALALAATLESEPRIAKARDAFAEAIIDIAQKLSVPTDIIVLSCLTLAAAIMEQNAPVKEAPERPRIVTLQ